MRRISAGFRAAIALLCAWVAAPSLGQDLALPGPYSAGWRQVTVTRANNTTFTAQLFYPATSRGLNAPYTGAGAPYAAVSFGHGFVQAVTNYQSTLEHLATHGYLVIASESEGGLFPSHQNFANDLSRCLTWLEQQHATPASWLFQQVDTASFGMSGHSMGGGASVLAAAADARVRVLANLAAANTNPSAIVAAGALRTPAFYLSGSSDTIVPVGGNGQPMYAGTLGPRAIPVIQGGFHCGFLDASGFGCDNGALPRAQQLEITRRMLATVFNLYLKHDQSRWRQVWGDQADADPRVLTQRSPAIDLIVPTAPLRAPGNAGAGAGSIPPGSAMITVTNTGPVASAFALDVEGLPAGWSSVVTPGMTAALAPGGAAQALLTIVAPTGGAGLTASAMVSARSLADGGTRAFGVVGAIRVCVGDATGDNAVTFADLNTVLGEFGQSGPPGALAGDVSGDGLVNFVDLNIVLGAFGTVCAG